MNFIKCKTWLKIHDLSLLHMSDIEIKIAVDILMTSILFLDFAHIIIYIRINRIIVENFKF